MEVAAGHVVLTPDCSWLKDRGGVEQPGVAFDFAWATMGFVDDLVWVVDGMGEDGGEFAEGSTGLGRSTGKNAGRKIKEQRFQNSFAKALRCWLRPRSLCPCTALARPRQCFDYRSECRSLGYQTR